MTAKDIQQIINSVLIKNGEQEIDDFVFGELVEAPNTRGAFEINNAWFVYETDEKNVKSILGPFYSTDIIYACAKLIHKSKLFEEYKFGKEAKTVYIHSHYRNLKEVESSLQMSGRIL